MFTNSVRDFEALNPNVTVEITMVPFANADQLFMTAAQGGEAPDLMRLSSDQLGAIGEVRVDGFPLLEDLRPHLTPQDRSLFEARALDAMRYGDELYGIPASQDCLSLIFNKALFDAEGLDYPDETWTEQDLLSAAEQLTRQDVQVWHYQLKPLTGGSLSKKALGVHFSMMRATLHLTQTVRVNQCAGCSTLSWNTKLLLPERRLKG